jgi:hypothetical protein
MTSRQIKHVYGGSGKHIQLELDSVILLLRRVLILSAQPSIN